MLTLILLLAGTAAAVPSDLESARDRQDRAALEQAVARLAAAAGKAPANARVQYEAALAASYLAEVSLELRDKAGAQRAAENGIPFAEKAVGLESARAEYHRILGTLCGQVIPANVLAGFRHGKRAREEIDRAIELDPKSARAYLSRGVGNYYLPEPLGPGLDTAIQDFQKAISLDPRLADAHLWLGLALRKGNRNAEARQAFTRALQLNPDRAWTKQQLEKTPTQ